MASWFGWNEPAYRSPRRSPADVAVDNLMLELSWQMKEAERAHRERESEYRRIKTGVDYSWLISAPRRSFSVSPGERLALEDLCSKLPPSYCGALILRFRQAVLENEPEAQEVPAIFRSVLLEALDRVRDEDEAQRLARQWNHKRAMSTSLMNFKSRVRINPFGSTLGLTAGGGAGGLEVKTVSEDVERGRENPEKAKRVWSMPDFRHKALNGKGN